MSAPPVSRLGLVGVGLIGGSIAAGVAAAWPGVRIIGVDQADVVAEARRRGWLHDARATPADLDDVDLIVLAAPMSGIIDALCAIGQRRLPALVTDVASTKREVLRVAADASVRFVGGHPMAGSERRGVSHGRPDLFAGASWLVVPGAGSSSADIERIEALATGLGAVPNRVDADTHDRVVAYVSHLPQLLAVALMNAAGKALTDEALAMAGPGLREMTRLAASSPGWWREVLESNADHVTEALDALRRELPSQLDASAVAALVPSFQGAAAYRRRIAEPPA